jgi:hypothetical protein
MFHIFFSLFLMILSNQNFPVLFQTKNSFSSQNMTFCDIFTTLCNWTYTINHKLSCWCTGQCLWSCYTYARLYKKNTLQKIKTYLIIQATKAKTLKT